MKLEDKVALVTGAKQGIGAAIAQEFLAEGARAVVGIDLQEMESAPRFHPFQLDISDHDAFAHCVDQAVAQFDSIDILVNNAGISFYNDIFNTSAEEWTRTQQVNIDAAWWAAKLIAPHMQRNGWGRIINLASTQALAVETRVGPYAASKGALLSLTRSLAVELAPFGILANAIAPGCIHTPMSVVDGVDETETELFRQWYVGQRKIPLARPGLPREVARVAVFLASADCSYITGQTLIADGGMSITF